MLQVKAVENENIVKLAAGEHYSMALNIHGTVLYSFGRQDYGQLGVDTRKPDENSMPGGSFEPTPQVVVFPGKEPVMIADIACGDRHSLALTTENEVYSWGFGTTGPTGHKTLGDEDIFVPTKLELQPNPKVKQNVLTYQIAGGGQHSLLVVKRYA
jgi:regulator of chromosome condensation